jgi:hypothetical protein
MQGDAGTRGKSGAILGMGFGSGGVECSANIIPPTAQYYSTCDFKVRLGSAKYK